MMANASCLTLDNVLLRVEGMNGEVARCEAGEGVDDVGTGERVNVVAREVEGSRTVHRPRTKVTDQLVVCKRKTNYSLNGIL